MSTFMKLGIALVVTMVALFAYICMVNAATVKVDWEHTGHELLSHFELVKDGNRIITCKTTSVDERSMTCTLETFSRYDLYHSEFQVVAVAIDGHETPSEVVNPTHVTIDWDTTSDPLPASLNESVLVKD